MLVVEPDQFLSGIPPARNGPGRPGAPEGRLADEGSGSKLLANLGNPAAVLLITGEMDGYLEPCGCTEGQIGGLLRRYDFLERLRKQNWPAAPVDLGSLTKDPAVARGGFEQAKFKFDYAIQALKLLDYSAVALSAEDMKVGVGEALALFLNSLGESDQDRRANVDGARRLRVAVPDQPGRHGRAGEGGRHGGDRPRGRREAQRSRQGAARRAGSKRPGDVLPGVLAELEPKTDYQVLMVQGPPELARSLAEAYPGFDVVVATSEYADRSGHDPDTLNGGKTLLIQVGQKGKYVGVVGLYPRESERMKLLARDPGHPVRRPRDRDEEADRGRVPRHPPPDRRWSRTSRGATSSTASRVRPTSGPRTCKSCHPNTYMKWSTTKHCPGVSSRSLRGPQAERDLRRRMRHLPHDRLRIQLGLEVGGRDALPEGQPVRELPRARLEARRRSRQRGLSQGDGADPREGRQEPPLPALPRRRQLAQVRLRHAITPRSRTRGSTTTRTRRSTAASRPSWRGRPRPAGGQR